MTDVFSKKKRSEVMSKVRGRDSRIEILFRKELWKRGVRYRKNASAFFGKPDLLLRKYKTVIFIDSCFWHACKKHFIKPSSKLFTRKEYKKNMGDKKKKIKIEKLTEKFLAEASGLANTIFKDEPKLPGVAFEASLDKKKFDELNEKSINRIYSLEYFVAVDESGKVVGTTGLYALEEDKREAYWLG